VTRWESKGKKLGDREHIAKFNFRNVLQFTADLFAIQMKKIHVRYDKPIYVYIAFTVLELSKCKMYNFNYDYMKKKLQENINLMYMDTDSFIYDTKTIDFYDDIRFEIDQHFDTLEYVEDNVFNLPLINKKKLCMLKDECKGNIIK